MTGKGSGEGVYTPSNLNMYGYVQQRPVLLIDPDGEQSFCTSSACMFDLVGRQIYGAAQETGQNIENAARAVETAALGSYSDPKATRLALEWATGTGPSSRTFDGNDRFTQSFIGSNAFREAENFLYSKYDGELSNDSSVVNWGNSFGIDDLFSDISLSGQFLGTVSLESATVEDGLITYTFRNSSTLDSFLYSSGRLEGLNMNRTSDSSRPASTITQTITVTSPVNPNWCAETGGCE